MFNYYHAAPKSAWNFRNLVLAGLPYMAIVMLPDHVVYTLQT